jgi:uncharacterized membrane protein YhaH (DUF805 family)
MAGVFLSYSRADRALAERIVGHLRGLGVEVWWDEDMRGVDWQDELERRIEALDAVLVLWTENSIASKNVRDEARLGLDREKLVNALVGQAKPPFPYDRVNGMPLDAWTGREPHSGWTRLVETIEAKIVAGGGRAGEITGRLFQREARRREAARALDEAREAFQTTQHAAGEAEEAAKAASAAFDQADRQFQGVVGINASLTVRRTAQAELDAALAATTAADEAWMAARGLFSEASRQLAEAERALARAFSEVAGPLAASPRSPRPLEAERTSRPSAPPATPPSPAPFAAPPARTTRGRRLLRLLLSPNGRLGRNSYLVWQFGALAVLSIVVVGSDGDLDRIRTLWPQIVLFVWISVALGAKRCHDLGRSGWFMAAFMVPVVGWAWGFYTLALRAGEAGPNRYGAPPEPADTQPAPVS